ncbi:TrkA C-terminal domain-containing protein [Natrinema soli]|uniref:TrkA C-terminal domain-containing protein n=1 Tax=Natrinema soli TaxID=1930624 RepID=A0ABD5SWQ6_9EURY|nr:TrkA C-terminal domain-containing protein [Natrinema soli]
MTGVVVLQTAVTEWTETALINILGFALIAGIVATTVAFGYRAASTRGAPIGVGAFAGLAVVAGWLNAAGLEQATIIDETPLVHHATATYVLCAVVVSAVAAEIGRRIGDGIARDVFDIDRLTATGEIASLVRSARLSIAIQLPERIDDAAGYPPVDPSVKRDLTGRTVLFPQISDDSALRSRLATRLERDYGLGHVSITIGADGTIERLAVGGTRSRIGASLPTGTVAMAIRADPTPTASVGDPIEVWTAEGDSNRLAATGTVRATAGDLATIAVDADAADRFAFDPGSSYRLTTRSEPPNDGDALCAVLRSADETVRSITVEDGGTLDNVFVGWLSGIVLVVVRDGEVIPFPADNETLRDGDELSVLGTTSELASLPPNGVRSGSP